MKQWHFYDKVYRRWVVLFIGPLDDFRAEMNRSGYKYVEDIQPCKGMAIQLNPDNNEVGNDAAVVYLNGFETATLVHEITHLVMMCFDQVGVPIGSENTESFAFYTEYWFTEMTKARRKHPNGISPKEAKK